ncbi:hypothetical protein [Mergibacter septicus]|nr:hypothetical protein [Mergibacter septicus]
MTIGLLTYRHKLSDNSLVIILGVSMTLSLRERLESKFQDFHVGIEYYF